MSSRYETLHLAKNLSQLESLAAEVRYYENKRFPTSISKLKSILDKLYKETRLHENDQEVTYLYMFRYKYMYNLVYVEGKGIEPEPQYKAQLKEINSKSEKLSQILKERYEKNTELETEQNGEEDKLETVSLPTESTGSRTTIFENTFITTYEFLGAIGDQNNDILVIDARPREDFEKSHLVHKSISIPEEMIRKGLSASKLEKILPNDDPTQTQQIWKKRNQFSVLVFMDWKSEPNTFHFSKLSNLYSSVVDWDINCVYPQTPVILSGGYLAFLKTHPNVCTAPEVIIEHRDQELDELLCLDEINYKRLEDPEPLIQNIEEVKGTPWSGLIRLWMNVSSCQELKLITLINRLTGLEARSLHENVNSMLELTRDEIRRLRVEITKDIKVKTDNKEHNLLLMKVTHSIKERSTIRFITLNTMLDTFNWTPKLDSTEPSVSPENLPRSQYHNYLTFPTPIKEGINTDTAGMFRELIDTLQAMKLTSGDKAVGSCNLDEKRRMALSEARRAPKPILDAVATNEKGAVIAGDIAGAQASFEESVITIKKTDSVSSSSSIQSDSDILEEDLDIAQVDVIPTTTRDSIINDANVPSGESKISKPSLPKVDRSIKPVVFHMEETDHGLVGLANNRNTCYINAVLQCMRTLPQIHKICCSGEYKKYCINTETDAIIHEFADVVQNLWAAERKSYFIPSAFIRKISIRNKSYVSGRHEDAMEFFILLLYFLHDDCRMPRHFTGSLTASQQTWECHFPGTTSIFIELFYHQIQLTQKCDRCEAVSYRFEIDNSFMLPCPMEDFSLDDQIEGSMSEFRFENFRCKQCKHVVLNSKTLFKAPEVAVLILKRYKQVARRIKSKSPFILQKINTRCFFNKRCQIGNVFYDLKSIVMHQGGLDEGHYTAACLMPEGWFEFNDVGVYPFHFNHEVERKVCAFFYTKSNN